MARFKRMDRSSMGKDVAASPSSPQAPSNLGQRMLLVVTCLALIGLAAALIDAGVDGRREIEYAMQLSEAAASANNSTLAEELAGDNDLGAWMFGDPYTSLVATGGVLIVLAVIGIIGAAFSNLEVLFWFYAPAFVMVAVVLYLGSFCFIFAADQAMYARLIHVLLSKTAANSFQMTHAALIKGGAFSLVSTTVLLLGLWSSSAIMGHEYALKSMAMSMNILTLGFGLFLLYLAILASLAKQAGQYASILIAVLGSLTSAFSLLGFCGLAKENRILLLLHAVLLSIITLVMVAAVIICFVLRSSAMDYMQSHWEIVSAKVAHISLDDAYAGVANHLLLIGVAGLILIVCLIYNLVTSIIILRSKWSAWALKSSVVDEEAENSQMVPLKRASDESSRFASAPGKRIRVQKHAARRKVVIEVPDESSSDSGEDTAVSTQRAVKVVRSPLSDSEATPTREHKTHRRSRTVDFVVDENASEKKPAAGTKKVPSTVSASQEVVAEVPVEVDIGDAKDSEECHAQNNTKRDDELRKPVQVHMSSSEGQREKANSSAGAALAQNNGFQSMKAFWTQHLQTPSSSAPSKTRNNR